MPVGVIMLDTRFPRPPGDIGNPATFGGDVIYERVPGAVPERVVGETGTDRALLQPFLGARDVLVRRGADVIATSCGFLVLFQEAMAAGCATPVLTSSLVMLPALERSLRSKGKRPAVLTFHGGRLGPEHLRAAGARADTPIAGTEHGSELVRRILANEPSMDLAAAERDVVDAGRSLMQAHAGIGAIVLECTNMPPYREALRRACGVPVYDIVTMIAAQRVVSGHVPPAN
ncbi:MAG: aspartate/glutamate racemase family protein [Alphaproteobacteria bacterium]|nr:aspartate/glutamate racemase family protein [Alphaproteobacteria bacterium]